jgi:hypothetical protein
VTLSMVCFVVGFSLGWGASYFILPKRLDVSKKVPR